jgi:hypothetical protein
MRLPAAVVCALAAHALVYRTVLPADGAHVYFRWYEPAVAGLSLACVAGLVALLAVAGTARRLGRPLSRVASTRVPSVRSLGVATLAVFLLQEAIERSVALGHPSVVVLAPSQWLTLFAGIALASSALVLALRLASGVARRLLAGQLRSVPGRVPAWSLHLHVPVRTRPLAGRFALRAPPVPSS